MALRTMPEYVIERDGRFYRWTDDHEVTWGDFAMATRWTRREEVLVVASVSGGTVWGQLRRG
jgi:hypothetical protein